MFHCEKIKLPSEQDVANKKGYTCCLLEKNRQCPTLQIAFLAALVSLFRYYKAGLELLFPASHHSAQSGYCI